MRAIFHRFGGLGPVDATVLRIHDDGVATLDVTVPGQPPARLFAPRGTGEPGTWEAVAAAPSVAIPPPDPTPPRARRPRAPRATVPTPIPSPLSGPDTCAMCLRKGRWAGFYCSDACEARAATPRDVDPWSKKRSRYTA